MGSGLIGGGGGGTVSPGTGDITDVFSCPTGDCSVVSVEDGESLNATGTGTITATSGDSATLFFSAGELERTLLPAASADCSAGNWAKGIDADLVLDCSQPAFSNISGSVTDAQVPNTITIDLATLATTATTANAGDSATAFFPSGELERTLLPAASGDCSASSWAKGVDADLILDCSQPAFTDISGAVTDAQVPNTITVDLATLATTATTATTALAGDSATAFFPSGELERTLLPAASADCGAGMFAKGIDADLVLDCDTPAGGSLPLTTKGDLVVRDASANVRLPVGADGTVLIPLASDSEGMAYATEVPIVDTRAITTDSPTIANFGVSGTIDYDDPDTAVSLYRISAFFSNRAFTSTTAPGPLYPDTFVAQESITHNGAAAEDVLVANNNFDPFAFVAQNSVYNSGAGDFALRNYYAMMTKVILERGSTGALTVADAGALRAIWPQTGGGAMNSETIDNWSLVHAEFDDSLEDTTNGKITATNAFGVRLEDFDDATNNYTLWSDATGASMIHAGKISVGGTTAPTGTIDVQGDGSEVWFDSDSTAIQNFINFYDGTETISGTGVSSMLQMVAGTYTIGSNLSAQAIMNLSSAVIFDYTTDSDPGFNYVFLGHNLAPTVKASVARSGTWAKPIVVGPVFSANNVAMTFEDQADIEVWPVFNRVSAGTYVGSRMGIQVRPTVNSTALPTYRGFVYSQNNGTANITTQVGVDIEALSGGTTNIGIRNADTYVATPTAQAIAAAGDDIACSAHLRTFTTATGTTTLTDNPIIADGTSGQQCILTNVDATATDCLLFTDSTQGLQLAGNFTMCPNDSLTLVYNGTDWIEQGRSDLDNSEPKQACIAIDNVTTAKLRPYWITPASGASVTAVSCVYGDFDGVGACSATAPTVEWEDGAANVVTSSGITCAVANSGTWTATTGTLTSGETLNLDVVTAGDTDCDIIACAQYSF